MKAKWLKIMLVVMSIALLIGMVACSDRANDDFTPDNVGEPDEKDTVYTVAVFNDTLYNVNYYLAGQTVILSSKQVPGKQFVRWEIDGEALSYQEQTTYVVEKSAVIKAVYTATTLVEVEDNLDGRFTVTFDEDNTLESGVLYHGYHFEVAVPVKQYYTFTGYYNENGTKVTDSKGKSIVAYDGTFTKLVPQFSENDYVNIVIKNGETGETVKEEKWYVEDGDYEAVASNVVDRQCVGWLDKAGEAVSNSANLMVSMKGLVAGATYEYTATYREAYKLMVISGYGSGAYAKEDKVNLSCTAPVGKEFLYWQITDGDVEYTLGVKVDGEKEYLGLISGSEFTYFDGERKVTQDNLDDVGLLGKKYDFLMGDLERIGVEIVGKQTIISAVFNQVIFYLTYKLDHMVDGVSALDEAAASELYAMGFVENNGILEKTVGYEYNDAISLINVPELKNYSFERWQSATGAAIPTTMPQSDVELVGTFKANKYNVTVVSPANGTVKIGSGGNTTSGYYSYNSTIKIFVTANLGYEFERWRNIEDMEITLAEVERDEGEVISYVFEYVVKEKQRFTVDFDTREYTIFYSTTVWYDGKDVTDDVGYFENYQEGYNQFIEKVKFGQVGTALRTQPSTSSMGLVYADYWSVTNWVVRDEEGNVDMNINPNNFVMPSYNIYAHCDYEINNYRISLSGNVGVESYSIRTINGKEAEEYLTDEENLTYTVPYGSDVLTDVKYNVGYDVGDVLGDATLMDEENALLNAQRVSDYTYEIAFKMLLSKNNGIAYSFYSTQNKHTLSYYVNVDYDNVDPDLDIFDYLGVDTTAETKEHDGKTYYRLLTVDDGVETKELTVDNYVYNQRIELFAFDASIVANNRYKFNNWNKIYNGKAYAGINMPDGDVYVYGDMVLDSFTLGIGTNKFEFDGNPSANVKTASDLGFTQDGEEETFVDGSTYRYYSTITLEPAEPTGYDFVQWQARTTSQAGAITDTVLNLSGEGIQKQDGYYYQNNADGTLTVYLTKNVTISATFKKKTFKMNIASNEVMVKREGAIGEYYYASDKDVVLEYGMHLTVVLNESRITDGSKVSKINIEDTDGGVLSAVDVPLNTEYYYYEQREFSPEGYYVTGDFIVNPVVERIKYTVTYVVYDALNDVHKWTSSTERILEDSSYSIELNETKVLMREEELYAKLAEKEISTKDLMYSGWFTELNADVTEGEGFLQGGRQYTSSKSYEHNVKNANVTFYCYLIEMYDFVASGSGVEIRINDVIKNTPVYNSYFTEVYHSLELPSVGKNSEKVIEVGDFAKMVGIEEVVIPSDVTTIKESAFSECTGLSAIIYNEKLTTIGPKAFFKCTSLTSEATENIPENVATIGESAFDGCASIERIVVISSIAVLQNKAFANIPNLKEVVINTPKIIKEESIGNGIFSLSGSETEGGFDVIFGDQIRCVYADYFRSNENADFGRYLGNVTIVGSEKGVEINSLAFKNSGLRGITLSANVTNVGEEVFFGCKNLSTADLSLTTITALKNSTFRQSGVKEVVMPSTVTSIGTYAFAGCDKLESLYYTANTDGTYALTAINRGAFQYEDGGVKTSIVRFVDASVRVDVVSDASSHKEIRIPEGIATIQDYAFNSCNGMEVLVIPSTVTTIGSLAFAEIKTLKAITYNVISAATSGNVFSNAGARGMTLTIGDKVEAIPANAFNGMGNLASLTIPKGLTSIGANAFANIPTLEEVNYEASNLNDLDGSIFATSTTPVPMVINIGASVEQIPANLFSEIGDLEKINVLTASSGSLTIRNNAFKGVRKLAVLDLPQMAELTLENGSFYDAEIGKVTFSNKIEKITVNSGALGGNSYLESMSIVYAGTEIAPKSAYLGGGTLVSTLNASGGYDTVVSGGAINVEKNLLIDYDNTLSLVASTISVAVGELRVAGGFTVDGESALTKDALEPGTVVAIPGSESDLIQKADGTIEYDALEIEREITVNSALDVAFDVIRIMQSSILTLNGGAEIIAESSIDLSGKIIVNSEVSLISEGTKQGSGTIEASNGAQTVVKIDDSQEKAIKTYVDNVNNTALTVSAGKVSITLGEKQFVVESGATVTTSGAFTWDEDEVFTLNGTLINNASAYVSKLVMDSEAVLTVNEKFTVYGANGGDYPMIEDESKIKAGVNKTSAVTGGTNSVYYKDLAQAFGDDVGGETGIVLNVREDMTSANTVSISYDAEVRLNGKTYGYTGNNEAFAVSNALTISGGTLDADDGTAFVVDGGKVLTVDGLTVLAINAFLMGSGSTLSVEQTEITAIETGITVEEGGATVTASSISLLATVGIEGAKGSKININQSTVEAEDYAIYMSEDTAFTTATDNGSTVNVSATHLSSTGNIATQDNLLATVYVGHLATVTIVNNLGELVKSESGTAILLDNRFIPDSGDGAFSTEDYATYTEKIKDKLYVDVSSCNVTGELAEVVRGQYARGYEGRIKVRSNDIVGLTLTEWSTAINYAKYVKSAEEDTAMSASTASKPYVALGTTVEIDVDVTEQNLIVANYASQLIFNAQEVAGEVLAEKVTEITVSSALTIKDGAEIGANRDSAYKTQVVVQGGATLTLEGAGIPINTVSNSGSLYVKTAIEDDTVDVTLSSTGVMAVESGATLKINALTLDNTDASFTNNGTLVANDVLTAGSFVTAGGMTVNNKLTTSGTFSQNAPLTAGEIESTGTYTIGADTASIDVKGNLSVSHTFNVISEVTVEGEFNMTGSYTLTIANTFLADHFTNNGMMTVSEGVTLMVTENLVNNKSIQNNGEIELGGTVYNDGEYREFGTLVAVGFINANQIAGATATVWGAGSMEINGNLVNKGSLATYGVLSVSGDYSNNSSDGFTASFVANAGTTFLVGGDAYNLGENSTFALLEEVIIEGTLYNVGKLSIEISNTIGGIENTGEIKVVGSGTTLTLDTTSYSLGGRLLVDSEAIIKASTSAKVLFTSGAVIVVRKTVSGMIEKVGKIESSVAVYLESNVVVCDQSEAIKLYAASSIDGEAVELLEDNGYVLAELQQFGAHNGQYAKYTHVCTLSVVAPTCGAQGYSECGTEAVNILVDSTSGIYAVYSHDGQFDIQPATGDHYYTGDFTWVDYSDENGVLDPRALHATDCVNCDTVNGQLIVLSKDLTEMEALDRLAGLLKTETNTETSGTMIQTTTTTTVEHKITIVGYGSDMKLGEIPQDGSICQDVMVNGDVYTVVAVTVTITTTVTTQRGSYGQPTTNTSEQEETMYIVVQ